MPINFRLLKTAACLALSAIWCFGAICAESANDGDDIEIVKLWDATVPRLQTTGDAAETRAKFEAFKELGSPSLANRKIAIEQVRRDPGMRTEAVLLSMLDPLKKLDEFTRIGAVRALTACPSTEKKSSTLAWCAVHDPSEEVRREACRTIRLSSDVTAASMIANSGLAQRDENLQKLAGLALREIDDELILKLSFDAFKQACEYLAKHQELQAQAFMVPPSPITGTQNNVSSSVRQIGSTALSVPVVRTQKTGVTFTVSGLPTMLQTIIGKDVEPLGWEYWLKEKIGELTAEQRSEIVEKELKRVVQKLDGKPNYLEQP